MLLWLLCCDVRNVHQRPRCPAPNATCPDADCTLGVPGLLGATGLRGVTGLSLRGVPPRVVTGVLPGEEDDTVLETEDNDADTGPAAWPIFPPPRGGVEEEERGFGTGDDSLLLLKLLGGRE